MAAKRELSEGHKKALQKGREEGSAVRLYLEALRSHKPRPGRKRTSASVERQLAETERQLTSGVTNPAEELGLIQRKLDLEAELRTMSAPKADLKALEATFIKVAASFSHRRGISRAAWREVGVPPSVLKRAGIK